MSEITWKLVTDGRGESLTFSGLGNCPISLSMLNKAQADTIWECGKDRLQEFADGGNGGNLTLASKKAFFRDFCRAKSVEYEEVAPVKCFKYHTGCFAATTIVVGNIDQLEVGNMKVSDVPVTSVSSMSCRERSVGEPKVGQFVLHNGWPCRVTKVTDRTLQILGYAAWHENFVNKIETNSVRYIVDGANDQLAQALFSPGQRVFSHVNGKGFFHTIGSADMLGVTMKGDPFAHRYTREHLVPVQFIREVKGASFQVCNDHWFLRIEHVYRCDHSHDMKGKCSNCREKICKRCWQEDYVADDEDPARYCRDCWRAKVISEARHDAGDGEHSRDEENPRYYCDRCEAYYNEDVCPVHYESLES